MANLKIKNNIDIVGSITQNGDAVATEGFVLANAGGGGAVISASYKKQSTQTMGTDFGYVTGWTISAQIGAHDDGINFNGTTGTLTPPSSGLYCISIGINTEDGVSGGILNFELISLVGGVESDVMARSEIAGSHPSKCQHSINIIINLSTSRTYKIKFTNGTGDYSATINSGPATWFSIFKV